MAAHARGGDTAASSITAYDVPDMDGAVQQGSWATPGSRQHSTAIVQLQGVFAGLDGLGYPASLGHVQGGGFSNKAAVSPSLTTSMGQGMESAPGLCLVEAVAVQPGCTPVPDPVVRRTMLRQSLEHKHSMRADIRRGKRSLVKRRIIGPVTCVMTGVFAFVLHVTSINIACELIYAGSGAPW